MSFDITTASTDGKKALIKFYQKYASSLHPEDPILSEKSIMVYLSHISPLYTIERYVHKNPANVAEIVVYGVLTFPNEISPEFESKKGIGELTIRVLPEFQNNGYGRIMIDHIISIAKTKNLTTLQYLGYNNASHHLSEKYGATKGPKGGEKRLHLNEINISMIQEWIRKGKKKNNNMSITFFQKIPEKYLDNFCNVYTQTINQAPAEGLEGEEIETPEQRRQKERDWETSGTIPLNYLVINDKDKIVGLTEMVYYPNRPYIIYQELTGVLPEFRGLGIGKWLKAKMIQYVLEKFPSVRVISTGTADTNDPMVHINKTLGFVDTIHNIFYNLSIK